MLHRDCWISHPPSCTPFSPVRCLIETIFSLDGLGLLGLRKRSQPRLSGGVRHALYFRADRRWWSNLISDLTYTWIDPRIDFETRGGLTWTRALESKMPETTSRPRRATSATSGAAIKDVLPLNQRRWENFKRQPPRLLGAVAFPGVVPDLVVRRVHRQRQAVLHSAITASVYFPAVFTYPETAFRRRPVRNRRGLSRSDTCIELIVEEGRHHDLAADPLSPTTPTISICRRRAFSVRRPGC